MEEERKKVEAEREAKMLEEQRIKMEFHYKKQQELVEAQRLERERQFILLEEEKKRK